jgi:hypothetical protein
MGETTRTPAGSAGTPRADNTRGGSEHRMGRGRRVQRAGLVVALLAALAAVASGSALTARWLADRSGASTPIPTATTTYTAPPPVELPLFRDGQRCGTDPQTLRVGCTYADLLCPHAVAWSPDERQVAILSHCGPFHGDSNTILVYDTAAGHLRVTFALDDIISRAPQVPDNCHGEPRSKGLMTQALFWLPSGRLAIVGSVYLWTALIEQTFCPPWDALVLIDADGTHPQLALAPARTQADGLSPCGRTWDLQTASPAAASAAGGDCQLMPALGYRWADGSALQPLTPLTSTTAPPAPGPGPIGYPAGGAEFTVWQSAVVVRSQLAGTPDAATGDGLYELVEPLSAFSPDGRYAYVRGRVILLPAGTRRAAAPKPGRAAAGGGGRRAAAASDGCGAPAHAGGVAAADERARRHWVRHGDDDRARLASGWRGGRRAGDEPGWRWTGHGCTASGAGARVRQRQRAPEPDAAGGPCAQADVPLPQHHPLVGAGRRTPPADQRRTRDGDVVGSARAALMLGARHSAGVGEDSPAGPGATAVRCSLARYGS